MQVLIGGFFVTNVHVWINWMRYLSFVYYEYGLLQKVNDPPVKE